ncbi:30S ribosomal protein S9 [Candidatus Berkelbacteria bacterium]|nr:30S ribosomal protein S9 [Candidatus Berkelbacteria bacterium]
MAEKTKYIGATGRRKRAVARVRLIKGKGAITINGKEFTDTYGLMTEPLKLANVLGAYDISAQVAGGGSIAQKQAIQLGIARALIVLDSTLKPTLRASGMVTRDPREKERKKPGLKRARRAPQWSKR